MIKIYSNSQDTAEILRHDMLSFGLPCAVYSSSVSQSTLVNILFTDYHGSLAENLDPESILYLDANVEAFDAERFRIYGRALDLLDVKYGINPESFYRARFMKNGKVTRYCGKVMLLTETETLIATHLEFSETEWCSAKELAAFCLSSSDDTKSVSTYITSINKKSLDCSLVKFIETRRNSGYRCTFREGKY